jgi:hypothetical protein
MSIIILASPKIADVVGEHPEPVLTKVFRYEKYTPLEDPMYSSVFKPLPP